MLSGSSTIVALLGLSAAFASPQVTVATAIAGGVILGLILIYGARWLQYHELLEAGASLTSAALTGRSRLQDKIYAHDVARLIEHASSTAELEAIIEDTASTFRFAHMQLRWGLSRQTPPPGIQAAVQAARLWSFDYPIAARKGYTDPLFLSVWCAVDGSLRPAGAERVTSILAPAIDRWIRTNADQVHPSSFGPHRELVRFSPRGPVADAPVATTLVPLTMSERRARGSKLSGHSARSD